MAQPRRVVGKKRKVPPGPGLAFLLEGSWAGMAGKASGLTRLGCV